MNELVYYIYLYDIIYRPYINFVYDIYIYDKVYCSYMNTYTNISYLVRTHIYDVSYYVRVSYINIYHTILCTSSYINVLCKHLWTNSYIIYSYTIPYTVRTLIPYIIYTCTISYSTVRTWIIMFFRNKRYKRSWTDTPSFHDVKL